MSLEVVSTLATVGTFFVIAATAIAALVQLRHLRASNQLQGLLNVLARIEDQAINEWIDGSRKLLREKMKDPEYRRSIMDGTFERVNNPWLNLANSYEWMALLMKHQLIPEGEFLDLQAYRVLQAWELLTDVVQVIRQINPSVWENFEYLAVRAQQYVNAYPQGTYPKGVARWQFRSQGRGV